MPPPDTILFLLWIFSLRLLRSYHTPSEGHSPMLLQLFCSSDRIFAELLEKLLKLKRYFAGTGTGSLVT